MPGGFVAVPLVSKSAISKVVPVRAAVRCAAIVGLSRISTSAPSNGDKWSHKPGVGGFGGDGFIRGSEPVGGDIALFGGEIGEPCMRGGMAAEQSTQLLRPRLVQASARFLLSSRWRRWRNPQLWQQTSNIEQRRNLSFRSHFPRQKRCALSIQLYLDDAGDQSLSARRRHES